jgi:tRNA(Arg) A34 adenosine deaminase TadA
MLEIMEPAAGLAGAANIPNKADTSLTQPNHETLLRRAFDVARRAGTNGNHPFGAILVGPEGEVLIETENGYLPDGDMTAHAERLLATEASRKYDPSFLARCTVYTSAEPCAMCAGALYWIGTGRVVFGLSERRLKAMTGNHPENPTLDLPCRTVFAAGQRAVEVIGPLLEDEAAGLHSGVWDRRAV